MAKSLLWLVPGCLSLVAFAYLLTRVDSADVGRAYAAYAAYGGIYITFAVLWLWIAEGVRPDRWDLPVLILVLLIPVRAFFQPMILRFGGPDIADTHGSARFATDAEARHLTGDADLLIGRDRKSGKLLRYPGPAHLLTIAPTRSGKGVGTVIPNLLEYPFACLCIDLKGENARIAARQRGRFGPVHVLDPFGITGLPLAAYNPLDRIDPAGLDVADDCMTLADALVHDAHNEQTEAHWNEEAKALIAGPPTHHAEGVGLAHRRFA